MTRRLKTLASSLVITKDGMIDIAITSLGYLALTVSLVAVIIAIVPMVLWIGCGVMASKLLDKR